MYLLFDAYETDAVLVNVKVGVKVKNHKIETIDLLKHDNGRGKSAEVIIADIINKQTLKDDAISKALNSTIK